MILDMQSFSSDTQPSLADTQSPLADTQSSKEDTQSSKEDTQSPLEDTQPPLEDTRSYLPPPLIALVGRPNVGKSSLFNRLTKTRSALVDDTPGLTRDRQYGRFSKEGRSFRLVDTGGFEPDTTEPVTAAMREQTLVAIEEADAIIFVTDSRTGPLADDFNIAQLLRRSGKPVICAVNKAEGLADQEASVAFYQLGLSDIQPISATQGMGLSAMMKRLLASLKIEDGAVFSSGSGWSEETVRVAVVGFPNAGKSTLINRLLGEERLVVSDVPGTTRDTIDLSVTDKEGRTFVLVDTAGIRRRARISLRIEKYSVIAALKAMDQAQVAVLILDVLRGITDQDRRVANLALDAGCGLVLAVNKWDEMSNKDSVTRESYKQIVADAFPYFTHAPVLFISGRSGLGVEKLLPTVHQVSQGRSQRVVTGALNRWLLEVTKRHTPPRQSGRLVKIRYATQVSSSPPTFLFFTNRSGVVHETYQRYLENKLRENFGFSGVPLRMIFRAGGENPYAPGEEANAPKKKISGPKRVGYHTGKRKADPKKSTSKSSSGSVSKKVAVTASTPKKRGVGAGTDRKKINSGQSGKRAAACRTGCRAGR